LSRHITKSNTWCWLSKYPTMPRRQLAWDFNRCTHENAPRSVIY